MTYVGGMETMCADTPANVARAYVCGSGTNKDKPDRIIDRRYSLMTGQPLCLTTYLFLYLGNGVVNWLARLFILKARVCAINIYIALEVKTLGHSWLHPYHRSTHVRAPVDRLRNPLNALELQVKGLGPNCDGRRQLFVVFGGYSET